MHALHATESISSLIKKLCEKITSKNNDKPSADDLKRLRSSAYEILLHKRHPETVGDSHLQNGDALCRLMAWQYTLAHDHEQAEHSEKLGECINKIENSSLNRNKVLLDMIDFLLILKSVPIQKRIQGSKLYNAYKKPTDQFSFRIFDERSFHLPPDLYSASLTSLESAALKKKSTFIAFVENDDLSSNTFNSIKTTFDSSTVDSTRKFRDFMIKTTCQANNNYISQSDVSSNNERDFRDVWEIVSRTKFERRRTWETLEDPAPEKERPFLPEANKHICNLTRHMQSSIFADVVAGKLNIQAIVERKISSDEFVADLKLLLVGVSSGSFNLKIDDFVLNPGFYVDGISARVLKSYAVDFLHSASCYIGLSEMCDSTANWRHFQKRGYIYKEICDRLNNFLLFYRISVSSHANSTNLLGFVAKTDPQRCQIDLIAQVCSVGPYKHQTRQRANRNDSISGNLSDIDYLDYDATDGDGSLISGDWREAKDGGSPSGVAMLDHLYAKVTHLSEGPLLLAAYAILLPCLEVYYGHFLQQWLFHGHFDDPYNEFFIRSNPKYLVTKGRVYWTRSYTIQHDLVPVFLTELADYILQCGKTMNLINITNQKRSNSLYWNEKIPNIRICLNFEQIQNLQQNMNNYYADILSANGKFSVSNILRKTCDENVVFLNLIAKKRAITLKRIECKKLIDLEILSQKNRKRVEILKENYEIVKRDKEIHKTEELEKEIALNEANIKIQELRDKIVTDEAMDMIDHYNKLFAISDKRKEIIDQNIQNIRDVQLKLEAKTLDKNASEKPDTQSLVKTPEEKNTESPEITKDPHKIIHTSKSLDFLNANSEIDEEINDNLIETLTAAQRNKLRVMSSEYNIIAQSNIIHSVVRKADTKLTDLQKNRFKVLDAHFEFDYASISKSDLTKNRLKVLSTEFGLVEDALNKNVPSLNDNELSKISSDDIFFECQSTPVLVDKTKLSLDFSKFDSCKTGPSLFAQFLHSPNFEFSKPVPMSIDTTPMSDVSITFKSSEFLDIPPSTHFSNEEFEFSAKPVQICSAPVTLNEVQSVSNNFLKIFLRDSVAIPLRAQVLLTNNTLLKYIFVDLQYFKHAQSLRDYFFLLDGEFGRNITDILFEALYTCSEPLDVLNIRFLNSLITEAFEFSSKEQTMSSALSFKINFTPKMFNLQRVDTLSCISMVYKLPWPLNILFPSDVIGKYDDIFKFLVKLRRVSWVLQKIFMEFKILSKRVGKRFEFLTLSPQYQRLHQFRHVMMHFIQTYENYIVGEVLQSSWFDLQEKLQNITNFDDLFEVHFTYIKNIEFMCLLNQKAVKLREAIYGIYTVILKFYEYLRARQWEFQETAFIHPNFQKLEKIYNNFENFVKFVFKASKKVASQGSQPQLLQFVDMLNVNDYYSKTIVDNVNVSLDSSLFTSYR